MKLVRTAAFAACLFLAAPAMDAVAQTPLDDSLDDHSAKRLDRMEQAIRELRAIVFQGREVGKPVMVEPADTDARLQALTDKVNDLEQAITRLNGQLDDTGHALDEARHETDALREENGALKDRISRLEGAGAPAAQAAPPGGGPEASGSPATPPPPPPPTADPAAAFAAARQAYDAHDNAAAEAGFKDYIDRFGDTPKAPEACYFLGKTLLARQDWPDAAAADVAAVRLWPQTSWAPDALLDLAQALVGMGKPVDACQMLTELDRRYPKANADVKTGAAALRSQAHCG